MQLRSLGILLSGFTLSACTSGAGGSTCVAGQQVDCGCPGDQPDGVQVCNADGNSYAPCQCSGTGATTGGGGSATSSSSTGSGGMAGAGGAGGMSTGGGGTSTGGGGTSTGGGGTGGSGGGGGAAVCVPGSQVLCYSGPPNTQGVGPCHAGTQQCEPGGVAYGPCMDEVVPVAETCATPIDDDCDFDIFDAPDCVCVPFSNELCYEGPAGTLDVGSCTSGLKTCNDLGTAWGPCSGQVLPTTDYCETPADEDCDGVVVWCPPSPSGVAIWAVPFHSGHPIKNYSADAVAVDPAGSPIVLVRKADLLTLGIGLMSGLVIVKLDPAGNQLWFKNWPAATADTLTTDANGNIYVTGLLLQTVDFGGGPLVPYYHDAYVLKLTAAGSYVWATHYGSASSTTHGTAISVDPVGNVLVGGWFNGSVNFGGGLFQNAVNDTSAFVLKLTSDGNHLWSRQGTAGVGTVAFIGATAGGDVAIAGGFSGSLNFGTGTIPSAGQVDVYVARFTPNGTPTLVDTYGDADNQSPSDGALEPDGSIIVGGSALGSIDFGGGPLTSAPSTGGFLAKLGPTGIHAWSRVVPIPTAVDADSAGNVLIAGGFTGAQSFGGQPVVSAGATDAFVVKYDSAGNLIWNQRFGASGGDNSDQRARGLAVDATGAAIFVGEYSSSFDYGSGFLSVFGFRDGFGAKLAP